MISIEENFKNFIKQEIQGSEDLKPHQVDLLRKCFYGGGSTVLGVMIQGIEEIDGLSADKEGKIDITKTMLVPKLKAMLKQLAEYGSRNFRNSR